ncbi:hypothetical protein HUJ04_003102, partial [Dendroctonus ponderosae]
MPFRCSIAGCGNTSTEVKLHCLPRDPEVRQKWCQVLNRNDLIDVSESHQRHKFRVCGIHFTEESKFVMVNNRTNLKYNAVPSLHLAGKILY